MGHLLYIYIYIINLTGQSVSVRTTFSDGRSFQNYSWWWRRDEKHRMREGQGIGRMYNGDGEELILFGMLIL